MDDERDPDLEMRVRTKVMDVQSLLGSGVKAATLEKADGHLDGLLTTLRADSNLETGGSRLGGTKGL